MQTGSDQNAASAYPIRAVDRVCDILDTLADSSSGVSLKGVAEAVGMPKSSVYRYLTALEARHYVERGEEAATFQLGPAFRPQHTRRLERLVELARPALQKVRDQLGETSNLGYLDGTEVVHALVFESNEMMRLAARVGDRGLVHSTALGKAMCATLPNAKVQSILKASGMPRATEFTITDPDAYFVELDRVREQGYAVDDAENQLNGRCVAVAIPGLSFPAAVSISAPADRLPREDVADVAKRLKKVAVSLAREERA